MAEAGRAPRLFAIEEGLPRQIPLLKGHRLNGDTRPPDEDIGLSQAFSTHLPFNDDGELHMVGHADPAGIGGVDMLDKAFRFGLAIEDRHQGGGVDDHFGRPLSSYSRSA